MQFGTYCNSLPDQGLPCSAPTAYNQFGARSKHPGGVNAALCDGSVRFYANDIAVATWQALSTSRGGEPLSGDQ